MISIYVPVWFSTEMFSRLVKPEEEEEELKNEREYLCPLVQENPGKSLNQMEEMESLDSFLRLLNLQHTYLYLIISSLFIKLTNSIPSKKDKDVIETYLPDLTNLR